MIVFVSLASLMTLCVVAWLLRPLLKRQQAAVVSSQQLNVAIYRDQLDALDADLARGLVSKQEHESARDELQLRMLDDVPDLPQEAPAIEKRPTVTAALVALTVVVGAFGVYRWLGSPAAIDPASTQHAQQQQVLKMVETLAQKLESNPDNPRGWAMLARSYKVMGRLDDAMRAYGRTGDLLETDPDLMADYADLLAVRAGDSLEGPPMVLVRKALAIDPKHPMSLMLSAAQSYREGQFAKAISFWETLLSTLEPQSPDAQQILGYIADARTQMGGAEAAAKAPADNPQVTQMVERLAARLKSNPDDGEGWARLARSYKVLGRMEESEKAYEKAAAVVAKNPDMLTDFADVLATRANGNLEGRPLELIQKALALQPVHPMGLMLSGTAAFRRGDFAGAIAQWEKLNRVAKPDSEDAQWLASRIAEAKLRLSQSPK